MSMSMLYVHVNAECLNKDECFTMPPFSETML
jgi:hypothetical protein